MSSRAEEIYYLDTSALVKRYVEEPRSETVDSIYEDAYRGVKRGCRRSDDRRG